MSFPKLRYVHLKSTSFGAKIPQSITAQSIPIDLLLDCLMERCDRNAEVQVLYLKYCYSISSKDVERLKEILDVIWDGVEQEYRIDDTDSW